MESATYSEDAFAIAYSSSWNLRLRTPTWIGAFVLDGADLYACGPPLPANGDRVLLADRVVLSHAGWKQWAQGREPLASRVRANAGAPLSGRQLRQWCPQVNAASIALVGAERCCAGGEHVEACLARGGTLDLWGFFQFNTRHLAAHRPRLQRALMPRAPLRALVSAALAAVRAEAAKRFGLEDLSGVTIICVHIRSKDDVLPIAEPPSAYRPAQGADASWHRRSVTAGAVVGTAAVTPSISLPSEWRDEGVFWAAPTMWYVEWLRAHWGTWHAPALILCTDDFDRSLEGALAQFTPVWLPPRLRALPGWATCQESCAHELTDTALEMLCDWEALRCGDVVAAAQSTFSLTATMAAEAVERPPATAGAPASFERWWRPDPIARCLVAYDPWDAPVLLNACDSGTKFRQAQH